MRAGANFSLIKGLIAMQATKSPSMPLLTKQRIQNIQIKNSSQKKSDFNSHRKKFSTTNINNSSAPYLPQLLVSNNLFFLKQNGRNKVHTKVINSLWAVGKGVSSEHRTRRISLFWAIFAPWMNTMESRSRWWKARSHTTALRFHATL